MADPLELYNAELNKRSQSYGDMNPKQFLDLAQGLGVGPVSTEFPGLGADFGGINRYLEGKTQESYKTIDTSVLEAQALSGNQRAKNELANRREDSLISPQIDIPPVDMSGLDIEYQVDEAAKEKKRGEAEAFRKTEKQLVDDQGGLNSMSVADSTAITKDNIEQASIAAMNDYIEAARGAGPEVSPVKDIKDYKEKFAEATGIDISGEVDKSHALMTFGLALMQNKAGKGFNVGKMLTATGAAGEKAMPALQKARERTRLDGIAAGKYALESQSADEAKALAAREKAMERTDYFVVPKSENVKGLLANLAQGEGKRKSLSKYELDKLMKNPEFASQFEVLPGSVWSSVVSEAMKTPEAKEYFNTTPQPMSLITGDDDPLYTIDVFYADPNQGKRGQVQPSNLKAVDSAYRALQKRFKSNQTNKEKFINLQTLSDEGAVNVFSTLIDVVDSAASAFGVNVSEGANPNEKMKALLTELQAKQASNILGEGGKNTSDFERQLVKAIVGDKTLFSNPDLIEFKLAKLYNDVVVGEENKILEGLTNLDAVSGKKISDYFGDGQLSEGERKSMNADLKAMGVDQ
tara:strand:- start:190 stop:1926 length:1737 start_codon:yes stop_codon:yes gene_type:complete